MSKPTFEQNVPVGEQATRVSCPECAVVALEELVEILEDFGLRARRQGLAGAARTLQERALRTETQVATLRSAIADNRAVTVDDEVSRIRATAAP